MWKELGMAATITLSGCTPPTFEEPTPSPQPNVRPPTPTLDILGTVEAFVDPTIIAKLENTPAPLSRELSRVLNDAIPASVMVDFGQGPCSGVVIENEDVALIVTDTHCAHSTDKNGEVTYVPPLGAAFTFTNPTLNVSITISDTISVWTTGPDYGIIGFDINPNHFPGGKIPFGKVEIGESILSVGDKLLVYGFGAAHTTRGFDKGHEEVVEIIDVYEREILGASFTFYRASGGIITGGDSGAGLFKLGEDGNTKLHGLALSVEEPSNGEIISHYSYFGDGFQHSKDNLLANINR